MFIFKYSKTIDEECWNRIINAGSMFGHDFPKSFYISDADILEAREKAVEYQDIWDNYAGNFNENIKKIYKYDFPEGIVCYINTSPYSMDNYVSNYISVSMKRGTVEKIISTTIHEACHFIFRKYYTDFCHSIGCSDKNIEDIKEIITVINNIVFPNVKDNGWKAHFYFRERILEAWNQSGDIKKAIVEANALLDKEWG